MVCVFIMGALGRCYIDNSVYCIVYIFIKVCRMMSIMRYKTEDEAFDAYMEECQEECGYDITESSYDWANDFSDWLDDNDVVIEELLK